MRQVALATETDWAGWRKATRAFVLAGIPPEEITWTAGGPASALPETAGGFNLPRALVALAGLAIQAREPERFGLLYSLVWRVHAGEMAMDHPDDPDLRLARRYALAVRAEAHRMRTHIRFLMASDESPLGWYAPAHFVLEANAQLLARRWPAQRFSIITPDGSAHWDSTGLTFGAGLRDPGDDETLLAWWEAHRAAVLQDARPGTSVPEAEALDEAPRPLDRPSIAPVVLPMSVDAGLTEATREALTCHRCPLHEAATQTVFGEGPANAAIMFVGDQPGDQEDVIGRPFVGPAGQLLDEIMEQAGIDRRTVYITNAVKHFKFEPRGKRRIHVSPSPAEIQVCRFWLDVERTQLRSKLLVLMGASAARAVLGRPVTISRERGRPFRLPDGQLTFVTVHPSFLLRIPEPARQAAERAAFQRDLESIRDLAAAA